MNQPSSSMQALAAHYGPPARRAAPLAEQFSLSQISTRSEDGEYLLSPDVPFNMSDFA